MRLEREKTLLPLCYCTENFELQSAQRALWAWHFLQDAPLTFLSKMAYPSPDLTSSPSLCEAPLRGAGWQLMNGSLSAQSTSATCQLGGLGQFPNISLPLFPLLKKRNVNSADLRGMLGSLSYYFKFSEWNVAHSHCMFVK